MKHLGFWAGGRAAHLTFLRERFVARRTRLAIMLSRRRRPEHQQRIRDLIGQIEQQFAAEVKRAARLIF